MKQKYQKKDIYFQKKDNKLLLNCVDTVMPMYNLIEYCDNYSKTSGSLWQYYNEMNDNLTDSKSFK